MNFTFDTEYNLNSMTSMAKALKQTTKRVSTNIIYIFSIIIIGLNIYWVFKGEIKNPMSLSVTVILVLYLLFKDKIIGFITLKRMPEELKNIKTTFNDEMYYSIVGFERIDTKYETIKKHLKYILEDSNYFMFLLLNNQVQMFDKNQLTGGTSEEFKGFIEEKTGKKVIKL